MHYTDMLKSGTKHNEWLKALDFYKEDLDILTNRLTEVAGKNTGQEAEVSIEHFENKFAIQRQVISDLQHRIQANEHSCAADIRQHAGKVNEITTADIKKIEKDVTSFENEIKELRKEFNVFLSRWM